MTTVLPRVRVLSEHPHLGRPGEIREWFDGAEKFIDAGFAEVVRDVEVETTDGLPVVEAAVVRPSARRRVRTRPDTGGVTGGGPTRDAV